MVLIGFHGIFHYLNRGVVGLTPGLAAGLHGADRISWDFPLLVHMFLTKITCTCVLNSNCFILLISIYRNFNYVAASLISQTRAVSSDELKNDEEYDEILDDMRQECSNFGNF